MKEINQNQMKHVNEKHREKLEVCQLRELPKYPLQRSVKTCCLLVNLVLFAFVLSLTVVQLASLALYGTGFSNYALVLFTFFYLILAYTAYIPGEYAKNGKKQLMVVTALFLILTLLLLTTFTLVSMQINLVEWSVFVLYFFEIIAVIASSVLALKLGVFHFS